MYEKKVNDGFEVLEIAKGAWIEAIFAKEKPEMEKPVASLESETTKKAKNYDDEDDEDDDDLDLPDDDEDKLTEESYRTTFDTDPEDLNLEAEDVTDDDDNY